MLPYVQYIEQQLQPSVDMTIVYSHCHTYRNRGYVIHGSNSCQIWCDLSKIAYEKKHEDKTSPHEDVWFEAESQ